MLAWTCKWTQWSNCSDDILPPTGLDSQSRPRQWSSEVVSDSEAQTAGVNVSVRLHLISLGRFMNNHQLVLWDGNRAADHQTCISHSCIHHHSGRRALCVYFRHRIHSMTLNGRVGVQPTPFQAGTDLFSQRMEYNKDFIVIVSSTEPAGAAFTVQENTAYYGQCNIKIMFISKCTGEHIY